MCLTMYNGFDNLQASLNYTGYTDKGETDENSGKLVSA